MHLWYALAPLDGFLAASAPLPPDERARAAGMRSPRRRDEFLAGRALLRVLLSLVGGSRAGEARIVADERGALRLAEPGPWRVNISHSRRRVAAVVCAGAPVGIDVEEADRDVGVTALLARFAHPDEATEVEGTSGHPDRLHGFFRLWTLKEAAAKAAGVGLGTDFRQFRVGTDGGWRPVDGLGRPCFTLPLAPEGGSFAALAVAAAAPPRRLVDMSPACASLVAASPAQVSLADEATASHRHATSLRTFSACPI